MTPPGSPTPLVPSLIVQGDHQAELLVACLRSAPEIAERYDIAHLPQGQDWRGLDEALWRRCAIFWRQVGGGRRQGADDPARVTSPRLDPRCLVVTWPALWFPALWPHRLDRPAESGLAYSDRLLARLGETGLVGPALFAHYLERDAARAGAAGRALELSLRRIFARDRHVRVPMGGFIAGHFRTERLFTSVRQPSRALLRELLRRLARATWPEEVQPGAGLDRLHLDCPALAPLAPPTPQLRPHDDPVSPGVAAELGLAWWSADDAYLVPRPEGGWRAWTLPDFVAAHVVAQRARRPADLPIPPAATPPPKPPADAPALLAESQALLAKGDAEGAIATAEAACALAPGNIAMAVHLAYLVAGRRPPEVAEAACRRALALAPEHAGANHAFSLFCAHMDRLPEAIASARKASLGAPRNFHTSAHLASLLRRTGDLTGAEVAYRLALTAAPDRVELHLALGELYAEAGLWHDAAASARRALELAPRDARAAALLARVDQTGAP